MFFSSFANGLTDHSASLYSLGDRCWAPGESGMLSDLTSVLGQESAYRLDDGASVSYFFKFSVGVELSFRKKLVGVC
jgi:hypothetical protein